MRPWAPRTSGNSDLIRFSARAMLHLVPIAFIDGKWLICSTAPHSTQRHPRFTTNELQSGPNRADTCAEQSIALHAATALLNTTSLGAAQVERVAGLPLVQPAHGTTTIILLVGADVPPKFAAAAAAAMPKSNAASLLNSIIAQSTFESLYFHASGLSFSLQSESRVIPFNEL